MLGAKTLRLAIGHILRAITDESPTAREIINTLRESLAPKPNDSIPQKSSRVYFGALPFNNPNFNRSLEVFAAIKKIFLESVAAAALLDYRFEDDAAPPAIAAALLRVGRPEQAVSFLRLHPTTRHDLVRTLVCRMGVIAAEEALADGNFDMARQVYGALLEILKNVPSSHEKIADITVRLVGLRK